MARKFSPSAALRAAIVTEDGAMCVSPCKLCQRYALRTLVRLRALGFTVTPIPAAKRKRARK